MKRKIIPLILIFLSSLSSGEEREEPKFTYEFSSGYSFGLSSNYKTEEDNSFLRKEELRFPLRWGLKYRISKKFTLRCEIDYQNCVKHEWGENFDKKEDMSLVIPYLDLIYFFKERRKISPYVGVGIGVSYMVLYIPLTARRVESGLKIRIFEDSWLITGISYYHFIVLYYGKYLSIRIGYEFY